MNLSVNTNEEESIAFLIRHKKTLRRLTTNDGLRLEGPEDSVTTLVLGTRDAVQWKDIRSLFIVSSKTLWKLGWPAKLNNDPELRQGMQDFLMRKSDINPFELDSA